ncbi:MAG: carbohydrate binding family 9 domain-containing protein, partial [Cytophagales bacterium]|nr:carbohydrate binding family 9 domain-containing protein [Cytophagales bacterium]
MRFLYFFLFLSLIPIAVCGQNDAPVFKPDSVRKTIEATEIQQNLKIDGRLDEAEWRQAKPSNDFFQVEPFQGQPLRLQTEVRVLFNRHYLYVAAFNKDTVGRRALRVPDFRRDFNFRSHDFFGIAIDGFNDKRNAMALMTNPYATQRDLLSFDDVLFDVDWDGWWRVRTQRTDSGWVAEYAIPWQTLRYPKTETAEQTWSINFFRNRRATNELS